MSAKILSFRRSSLSFFVSWVVITGIAIAVGQMGALALAWSVGDGIEASLGRIPAILVFGLLIGVGMGGCGAASQILFLQGRVDARRWILGAVVGAVLAMILGMMLVAPASETMDSWVTGLLAGATVGAGVALGQWVALRGRLPGVERWAVVCFLAYSAALLLLFGAGGEGRELFALTLSGLAFGLIGVFGVHWAGLLEKE